MKRVQIGEVEIPNDYFKLTKEEKRVLCIEIMDVMLTLLDKNMRPELDRLDMLDLLLQSSIISNEETEKYEICQFLFDVRKILHE